MDDPNPTWRVPERLRANAKSLRRNATDAERLLWSLLRNHRLNGTNYRRQVPVASFVADFVCHAAKLVIELDGGQHFSDRGEEADQRRTTILEGEGFRVLRFSDHDVLTTRDGVLQTIAAALDARAPTPPSPQAGEGAGCHPRSLRALT